MRMLVTKVNQASLYVKDELISKINEGYIIYLGIKNTDNKQLIDKAVRKTMNLRIYHDSNGKINLKLNKETHEILVVSQFTLYGDVTNNNRPSFTNAADPDLALELYEYYIDELRKNNYKVKTGSFGAHMKIDATYIGPFNLIYEIDND